MKIVVMSDTHLNGVSDELADICTRYCDGADMVIHLGDWVATSVLDYMLQYPLEAVAGNTDNYDIHDRLPVKKVLQVGGRRIGIIHGWGSSGNVRGCLQHEFSDVDAVLFGHTHQPLRLKEDGVFWFNPGSVFAGRGYPRRSLGILHVDGRIEGQIIPL
jgi:uncharacterized protein